MAPLVGSGAVLLAARVLPGSLLAAGEALVANLGGGGGVTGDGRGDVDRVPGGHTCDLVGAVVDLRRRADDVGVGVPVDAGHGDRRGTGRGDVAGLDRLGHVR